MLAQSIGTSRSECVRIRTTGEYIVVVNAFSGFANYQLAWGSVALGTSCPNSTMSVQDQPAFVAGQFFVKARAGARGETRLARTASVARTAQLSVASLTWHDGPVLLEMPPKQTRGSRRCKRWPARRR